MVSLLPSNNGCPEGFAPIPSSVELPCEGKLHRRSSHGVGFQISLRFCVLRNEGFYGGRSANPATNLLIRSNPTAGGRPQTQLGTRYGWPLAHKELLCPLTGFVFNPAGCPYPNTLLTKKTCSMVGLSATKPSPPTRFFGEEGVWIWTPSRIKNKTCQRAYELLVSQRPSISSAQLCLRTSSCSWVTSY